MAYGNNNYYGANNYATPFTPYTQNQSYAQPNYYNNAMGMNNNSYVQQPIMNNGINQNQQQSNQQIYLPLTFVSDIKASVLKEKNLVLVEEAVIDVAVKAKRGGIEKEEVIALFEKHFESEATNDNSRNKES